MRGAAALSTVMPGLGPGIHVLLAVSQQGKTWMAPQLGLARVAHI
jgi:hypothetical protein